MNIPVTQRRKERIEEVLARRQPDLTLVMDNIWDPHNVSAVLRSCDAFGVHEVQLYYTTSPWPDMGKRTSASARKWVRRIRHENGPAMIGKLRDRKFQILRTGFSDTARPVMDFDYTIPTAIILSNEHDGTAPELAELVSDEVYIPMQGMVQSFNVSVAAAIILYQAFLQRNEAGMYDSPRFDDEEFRALCKDWYSR